MAAKLEPGEHFRLGRLGVPVVAEASEAPEAQLLLSFAGGWCDCRWYIHDGVLLTLTSEKRGKRAYARTGLTIDDLEPAGR